MKVFLTSISECDKKGFIEETIKVAEKNNQTIKYFSMGDMLMERIKSNRDRTFNPENILNLDEGERSATISSIINELKSEIDKHDNVIISGHATFYWNKNFTNAFNWDYLNDLNPDMFITLIENTEMIYQNMSKSKQFAPQQMTHDEILAWQNVEVNNVAGWSQFLKKDQYILPRRESQGLLYKIMMKPEMELVYASFPMSNIKTDEDKKCIDDFVNRLNEYFAVITPRSIELSKEFSEKEGAQTVLRDIKWFTGKSKKTIVYYMPHKPELVFSAGVMTEIVEGFNKTSDILGVFPDRYYGPFEHYYIKNMFHSEDDLFKYIESQGYKKTKIFY